MDPYVGEIRMFAGNFAPVGWMLCNGDLLAVGDYPDLFGVIGSAYGGDGRATFALPDLRGRTPIHRNPAGAPLGSKGGQEAVTLGVAQLPAHGHTALAEADGTSTSPAGNVWAGTPQLGQYTTVDRADGYLAGMVGPTGGGLPHDNRMPFLAINFIIAVFGINPTAG